MEKRIKKTDLSGIKNIDLKGQPKNRGSESVDKKKYKQKYEAESLYFYDKVVYEKLKSICKKQGLTLNQVVNMWAIIYVSKNEKLIK